jgi:hypothetical protein
MRKVSKRSSIQGQDFQWPILPTSVDTSAGPIQFLCGEVMVKVSGGKNQTIDGAICGDRPDLPVNFAHGDILLGSGWIEKDFTDAIRVEFDPPVRAVGVQFAINSRINNIEFTAIIRASTTSITPVDKSNNTGVTNDDFKDTYNAAIFLGVQAEGDEMIKVIRMDVKPRGRTTSAEILGFFVNQLRLCP